MIKFHWFFPAPIYSPYSTHYATFFLQPQFTSRGAKVVSQDGDQSLILIGDMFFLRSKVDTSWMPISSYKHYNHKTLFFSHIYDKSSSSFWAYFQCLFRCWIPKLWELIQHVLLQIKDASMYGMHTNEKIEQFVNMYISMMYHVTKSIAKCTTST
jgi:hypothetical protein